MNMDIRADIPLAIVDFTFVGALRCGGFATYHRKSFG
jgi:hypothetical protein